MPHLFAALGHRRCHSTFSSYVTFIARCTRYCIVIIVKRCSLHSVSSSVTTFNFVIAHPSFLSGTKTSLWKCCIVMLFIDNSIFSSYSLGNSVLSVILLKLKWNEMKMLCVLLRTDRCVHPPRETGPCYDYAMKYSYVSSTGYCEAFYYGGCEGNDNRFDSAEECEATCIDDTPASATQSPG